MEPKTSSASCLNVNRGFVLVATGALHFASASMMSLATKEYMHLYSRASPCAKGAALLTCVLSPRRKLAGNDRPEQRTQLGGALGPKACFEAGLRLRPCLKAGL